MNALLQLNAIEKSFYNGQQKITVLRGVSLTLQAGETVALIGPSGSGKSTLLATAGLLEKPDAGSVLIQGINAGVPNDTVRTRLRLKHLGFVYQFHHLLPEFTALENVILPQLIANQSWSAAKKRATELLQQLDLSHRLQHHPSKLSGGEQQRVAIARALANKPSIILADEPTGNLDAATADSVVTMLHQTVRAQQCALLMVTHNPTLAQRLDLVLQMDSGALVP